MKARAVAYEVLGSLARIFLLVVLVAAVTFSLFGLAASLVVAGLFYATGPGPDYELIPRFLIKAVGFAVVVLAAFWGARKAAKSIQKCYYGPLVEQLHAAGASVVPPIAFSAEGKSWLWMVPVVVIVAALVFPRLGQYPWAAPDEIHHLTVARNLATLGVYASGHPDAELVPFDTYDSVGPPVILPVALAFRLFGVNLVAGRMVMGVYLLAFCVVLFAFFRPWAGAAGAAMTSLLVTSGFGSVYLGRTLYGEVPGLMWLCVGLICWRNALKNSAEIRWGLAAGLAIGLAVLCKSILLLSAFAFLGALMYDHLTFRRIRLTHVVAPAVGVVAVMAAWWALQTVSRHDVTEAAGGTLGIYKHNLMFGLGGWHALPQFFTGSTRGLHITLLALGAFMFWLIYDPALVTLWFVAMFYAWWWVFFTPGTMPRYLWYTLVIGSALLPLYFWMLFRLLRQRDRNPLRVLAMTAIAGIFAVTLVAKDLPREVGSVYTCDEMRDDSAVSAWAAQLPGDVRIAATWPVSGSLNFLANKHARELEDLPDRIPAKEVLIIDTLARPEMLDGREPDLKFGRYAVLTGRASAME